MNVDSLVPIHSLLEGDKCILIMQKMSMGVRVSRTDLAKDIGLEHSAFYSDRDGSHRGLWTKALNSLVSSGYISTEIVASRPKNKILYTKVMQHEQEHKDLQLDKYYMRRKVTGLYQTHGIKKTKKDMKSEILSVLNYEEVINGRQLAEKLHIPQHYFTHSATKMSKAAKKWMQSLIWLVNEDYIYMYPNKQCKLKKIKDVNKVGEVPLEELQKKVEAMDDISYKESSLSDRLSNTVQELLVIAKEVAEERLTDEFKKQLADKNLEIDALREELDKKKNKGLLGFLK